MGSVVTVHYDPHSPHRAAIEPGGYLMQLFLFLFGVGFMAVGIGTVIFGE